MKLTPQKQNPEKFGVFCKNCGTYDVEIHVSIKAKLVFYCEQCDEQEIL